MFPGSEADHMWSLWADTAASSTDSPPCCCVVATSCVRKSSSWISQSEPTHRSKSPDQRQEAEQWRRIHQEGFNVFRGRAAHFCVFLPSVRLLLLLVTRSLAASRRFMDAQLTFTADWRWLFFSLVFMDVLLIPFKPFQSLWDISGSSASIISGRRYRFSLPVCSQLFDLFMLTRRRLSPPLTHHLISFWFIHSPHVPSASDHTGVCLIWRSDLCIYLSLLRISCLSSRLLSVWFSSSCHLSSRCGQIGGQRRDMETNREPPSEEVKGCQGWSRPTHRKSRMRVQDASNTEYISAGTISWLGRDRCFGFISFFRDPLLICLWGGLTLHN